MTTTYVKTSFELPVDLLQKAYSLMPNFNKRSVVEKALEEFVENHQRKSLRDIRDEITFDDDFLDQVKEYRTSKFD